jgi:hypothetical protein
VIQTGTSSTFIRPWRSRAAERVGSALSPTGAADAAAHVAGAIQRMAPPVRIAFSTA